MDIIIELLRYIIIIIIGIILITWYEKKKGWEYQFRTSFFFILCWRTIMFFIFMIINYIFEPFLLEPNSFDFSLIIYSITLVIVTFFINIFLGVIIFKFVYNQKAQESVVIILIIVIIEIILDSFLSYTILIPETLISN
jgi:hypothetical protein